MVMSSPHGSGGSLWPAPTIDEHQPRVDQLLHTRAADVGNVQRDDAVESLASVFSGNDESVMDQVSRGFR